MRALVFALLGAAILTGCNAQPASQPIPAATTSIATATPTAQVAPTVGPTIIPTAAPSAALSQTFTLLQPGTFQIYGDSGSGGVNLVPFWTIDYSCGGDPTLTCPKVWGSFIPTTTGVYQAWLQIGSGPPFTLGQQQVTGLIPSAPYWAAFADVPFGTTCPAGPSVVFWVTWTSTGSTQQTSNSYTATCPSR